MSDAVLNRRKLMAVGVFDVVSPAWTGHGLHAVFEARPEEVTE
jgi:hypothetical protein